MSQNTPHEPTQNLSQKNSNAPQSQDGPVSIYLELLNLETHMLREIERAVSDESKELVLNLSVPYHRGGTATAALAVLDILQKRSSKTRLTTRALTILPPPEALLWLSGDLRDAAPHSGIVLPGIEPIAETSSDWGGVATLAVYDRHEEWRHAIQQSSTTDLRQLISEYVELKDTTSVMRFDTMKEFGLVGDQFMTLFSAVDTAMQVTADANGTEPANGEEFSARM